MDPELEEREKEKIKFVIHASFHHYTLGLRPGHGILKSSG